MDRGSLGLLDSRESLYIQLYYHESCTSFSTVRRLVERGKNEAILKVEAVEEDQKVKEDSQWIRLSE